MTQIVCPVFIPLFYKDMLNYGREIFFYEFSHMIIWNNRAILVENKSINFKDWAEQGVIFIQDLLNEGIEWMSFREFTNKYNISTNFLRYMGITSTIKAYPNLMDIELSIKPVIYSENNEIKVLSEKTINLSKSKSKTFYLKFLNFRLEPPTSLFKWSEKHSLDEALFMI